MAKLATKKVPTTANPPPKTVPPPLAEEATRPNTDDEEVEESEEEEEGEEEEEEETAPTQAIGNKEGKGVGRKAPVKLSARCGIHIPPGMIKKRLAQNRYAPKVSIAASAFLAGAIEALLGELFPDAIECAESAHRKAITAQHLFSAIRKDEEFSVIFKDVIISRAGNPHYTAPMPNFRPAAKGVPPENDDDGDDN